MGTPIKRRPHDFTSQICYYVDTIAFLENKKADSSLCREENRHES